MKAVCAILRFDCQIYYSGSVFFDKAGPVDLPGGHSKRVPPESISNSEVKTLSADDSAGVSRVKVGTAGHLLVQQMPAPTFGMLSLPVNWTGLNRPICPLTRSGCDELLCHCRVFQLYYLRNW